MLVWMTLTLMQGESGKAKGSNQRRMLSAANEASNKHYTCYNGRPFLRDLDIANVYIA